MRPIKPDKHRSHRERKFRDQIMAAVRKKIWDEQIPCSSIIVSRRPMLTAVRARILRGDIDDISFTRACLIADAVGLDLTSSILPKPAPEPLVVEVVREVYIKPQPAPRRCRPRPEGFVGDLFDLAA
jgi:hypothetical protein